MTENNKNEIIDFEEATRLLGVTRTNLRQLVYRKKLVPTGRQKRRSTFHLADVLALQIQRSAKREVAP